MLVSDWKLKMQDTSFLGMNEVRKVGMEGLGPVNVT